MHIYLQSQLIRYLSLSDKLASIVLSNNSFQSLVDYRRQNSLAVVLTKGPVDLRLLVCHGTRENPQPNFHLKDSKHIVLKKKFVDLTKWEEF